MVEPAWAVADIATSGSKSEIVRRCFVNMVRLHHCWKRVMCALLVMSSEQIVGRLLAHADVKTTTKCLQPRANRGSPNIATAKVQSTIAPSGSLGTQLILRNRPDLAAGGISAGHRSPSSTRGSGNRGPSRFRWTLQRGQASSVMIRLGHLPCSNLRRGIPDFGKHLVAGYHTSVSSDRMIRRSAGA